MLPDAKAVLDLAAENLQQIHSIYEETLHDKEASPRLRALIKNVVENQRSALDYVAHAVTQKYGKSGTKTYWPYCEDPTKFVNSIDGNMPGVGRLSQ